MSLSINIDCWCLGLIICSNTFFTLYIHMLAKVILVHSTISLLMFTISTRENGCSIIGMSIWLPIALVPSALFYYFCMLPLIIKYSWGIINILQSGVNKFEKI